MDLTKLFQAPGLAEKSEIEEASAIKLAASLGAQYNYHIDQIKEMNMNRRDFGMSWRWRVFRMWDALADVFISMLPKR